MRAMLSAAHAVAVVATRKWFVSAHGMRCRDRRCSSICPSILMESNLTTYVSIRGRRARVCSAQKLSNLTVYVSGFFISPVQDGVSYELSNLRCASVRFESNGPVSKRDCVDRFSSMAHVSYSPWGEKRNEVRYVRNLQGAHPRSFGHCQITVPPLYLVDCIPVHATWIAAAAPLSRIPPSCDAQLCNAAHA